MRTTPTAKMSGYNARGSSGYSNNTGSDSKAPDKLLVYTGPSKGTNQVILYDEIEQAVDTNNSVMFYLISDLELDANL